MNCSLQVSISRGRSFDVYPNDSRRDYLRSFISSDEGSKMAIWVDDGIIYYYSLFKLPGQYSIGLLLGFKDLIISNPRELIQLLAGIVADEMPRQGSILQYSTSGDIILTNASLADSPKAVDSLRETILKAIASNQKRLLCQTEKIPHILAPDDKVDAALSDNFNSIKKQLYARRTVVLSSGSAFINDKTYNIIKGLRADIVQQKEEISQKEERIRNLERSRKQYRFVLGLLGCLLLAGVGLYQLNANLNQKEHSLDIANQQIFEYENKLSEAKDTINERERQISDLDSLKNFLIEKNYQMAESKKLDSLRLVRIIDSKNTDIENLNSTIAQRNSRLSAAQNEISNLKSRVTKMKNDTYSYPFISTGFSKAGSTLYISYNSFSSRSVDIEIRCFNTTSYLGKSVKTVSVHEGSGKLTINSVSGLDGARYVIIYYDGHIIGGQWF